ncbi:MAG: enoyl-CoA hydratase-related protein [Thermodesulfobacteriota bacterium]|nr:enoyl-CoA hydratase-related protein [Thermodesulfobacteriota bacterium]
MSYENLTIDVNNYVATVTINRPPVNSVNLATIQEMDKALDEMAENKDIRVIILTGSGEKSFSAGFDVSDAANAAKAGEEGQRVWTKIFRYTKPVIAAVNGFAFGGGCELAMACHFRLMSDAPKAKIGLTELNLGIIPGWAGTQRMTQLLGRTKALELILFSKRLQANEALEVGLVNKVCPPDKLMDEAREMAEKLINRPPLGVASVLKAVADGMEFTFDQGLKTELEGTKTVSSSQDAVEGFTAFFEKRDPVFKGE